MELVCQELFFTHHQTSKTSTVFPHKHLCHHLNHDATWGKVKKNTCLNYIVPSYQKTITHEECIYFKKSHKDNHEAHKYKWSRQPEFMASQRWMWSRAALLPPPRPHLQQLISKDENVAFCLEVGLSLYPSCRYGNSREEAAAAESHAGGGGGGGG